MRPGERAQTEALGYALILGVVVVMLAIVTTAGYANLTDARDHERVTNSERGFETFAANVDDLARNDAESRATELPVTDGRLVSGNATRVTVRIDDGASNRTVGPYRVRSLVYDGGAGRVVYEGGAVFRNDSGGAVMVREPHLLLSRSQVVFPVVRLDDVEPVGASGKEAVLLRTSRDPEDSGMVAHADPPGTVTVIVEVTSPRAGAWQRYLEGQDGVTCSRADDTVTCTVETRRASVTLVDVEIERAS